jgi:hypothetical protein
MSAEPCSTEWYDPKGYAEAPGEDAIEMHAIVDSLERFVGNIRVLSADARAHLDAKFDRLRKLLPEI